MKQSKSPGTLALVLVWTAVLGQGCHSATILRRGAPDLEAVIVDGDAHHLYVQNDFGRVFRIDRAKVRAIDHPGAMLMTGGGAGLFLGLIVFGLAQGTSSPEPKVVAASVLGGSGLVFGAGLMSWSRSRDAAEGMP